MRTRRTVVVAALALVAVVVVCAGWLAWQGLQARDELNAASAKVGSLQSQVLSGDLTQARSTVTAIQQHTAAARDHTTGPVWSAASVLPVWGDDVSTVREMAVLVDDLANDVLDPLVDAGSALDPAALQPTDGQLDLHALREAQPLLAAAHDQLTEIQARARALPKSGLIAEVANARDDLVTQLDKAAEVISPLSTAADLMPAMLGADGPRTYLLLFQNNAEVRATGGMPGAMAVIRADQGRISLAGADSAAAIGRFSEPVVAVPSDLKAMFGTRPARWPSDLGATPNWPWAANTAAAMYEAKRGVRVDGVGAVDPVVLSYLLEGQGEVALANGTTITADTAVDTLLNQVYLDLAGKPVQQNELFAAASATIFARITDGAVDPEAILSALSRGAQQGRVMLWSAQQAEQQMIAPTALDGPLRPGGTADHDPPEAGPQSPLVGVFLNSATPSKLDYYLRQEVTLSEPQCRAGGKVRHTVTLKLTSTVPSAAARLPKDVLGPLDRAAGGQNLTQVLVYASPGGELGRHEVDGQETPYQAGSDAGYATAVSRVTLDPGQTRTISTQVLIPNENLPAVLRVTPTATPPILHPNGLRTREPVETCS